MSYYERFYCIYPTHSDGIMILNKKQISHGEVSYVKLLWPSCNLTNTTALSESALNSCCIVSEWSWSRDLSPRRDLWCVCTFVNAVVYVCVNMWHVYVHVPVCGPVMVLWMFRLLNNPHFAAYPGTLDQTDRKKCRFNHTSHCRTCGRLLNRPDPLWKEPITSMSTQQTTLLTLLRWYTNRSGTFKSVQHPVKPTESRTLFTWTATSSPTIRSLPSRH